MSNEAVPQARRMRRPTWRDPRLGVGIILIAGSVALGTWAVRDAAATVEVYAAAEALTPGEGVTAESLQVREVRLGDGEDQYVLVADGIPDGAVTTRTVGPGELVPRSALGEASAVDLQPVIVDLGMAVPADLGPGGDVDLWLAPEPGIAGAASDSPAAEPELVAPGLTVAEVVEDDSVLAGSAGTSVELLVRRDEVATVLAALSSDGRLVAVPTAGATAPADDGEIEAVEPSTGDET